MILVPLVAIDCWNRVIVAMHLFYIVFHDLWMDREQ